MVVIGDKALPSKDRGCRITEARKAAGALVRPFFAKPQVKYATKAPIFKALVCSRHLYNVHTWTWVTDVELEKWANGLRDPIRKMLDFRHDDVVWYQLATADLYALAALDTPLDSLHAARLRYLKRAIKVAPPILWQLLWNTKSSHTWLSRLLDFFSFVSDTLSAPLV